MSDITLNLNIPLTDDDRAILTALASAGRGELPPAPPKYAEGGAVGDIAKTTMAAKPDEKVLTEGGVKKSAPKKRAPAKAKPAEPEAPAEDEDDGKTGTPVDEAVARAAALLAEGKAAKVKEALATLDIQRVSQLKPSQVSDFLTALEA